MGRSNGLITKNRNGEFIYPGLNSHMNKKYKADTPLDNSVVPYIIMLFCALVDAAVFISLFKMISYDFLLYFLLFLSFYNPPIKKPPRFLPRRENSI